MNLTANTIAIIRTRLNKILDPPALQASCTGSTEIKTAAKPPKAVKPIIPKFIRPA